MNWRILLSAVWSCGAAWAESVTGPTLGFILDGASRITTAETANGPEVRAVSE